MSEVSIVGVDIAKSVFQVHGADASGRVLLRKKVSRAKLLEFFTSQPSCQVVLEACGGAHHWARELAKLGHDVRLIAPAYVKPFVKRQKNDAADAEAICEAAQRPSMRFVPVKTEAQQAAALVCRLYVKINGGSCQSKCSGWRKRGITKCCWRYVGRYLAVRFGSAEDIADVWPQRPLAAIEKISIAMPSPNPCYPFFHCPNQGSKMPMQTLNRPLQ